MTTIGLSANDQLLAVTLNPKVTSGQQNTVDIHVEFSDDWDRFAKSAVFFTSNNTNTVYEKVLTNGECIVPAEVMSKDGILYIGVRGVNSQNNEVKTTSLVKYKISEGSPSGTGTEVEPTPDIYQQLLSAYGKTDSAITQEVYERKTAIATEKTERQTEIAVERNRITNLASLSEGSTTGDAELIDARVGYDGKIFPSVGDAIRTQIGDIEECFIKSINLYNEATNTIGVVISSEGVETANSYYATTDYIFLNSGSYVMTYVQSKKQFSYMAKYDCNKVFKSRTDVKSGELVITEPCYVRFSGSKVRVNEIMLVKGTELPNEYIPYSVKFDMDYIDKIANEKLYDDSLTMEKVKFIKPSTNLINHMTITEKTIVSSTGVIQTEIENPDAVNYCITDKIWLNKSNEYTCRHIKRISYFKKDGTHIGSSDLSQSVHNSLTFTTINDFDYVILTLIDNITQNPNREWQLNEGAELLPYEKQHLIIDGYRVYDDFDVVVDPIEELKNKDRVVFDNAPLFTLDEDVDGIDITTQRNSASVFAMYNELLAQYPEYITRTELGTDSLGNMIYRYDFNEPEQYHSSSTPYSTSKPKAILIAGIHGEYSGIYSLFHAMKQITTNPKLIDVKRNTHFIVVPVVNIYGVNNNKRKNENGIDLARNFEVGFTVGEDPSAPTYGGTTPLSELGCQYIDNILRENSDAIFFNSCHSFAQGTDAQPKSFMWGCSATKYFCNLAQKVIDKLSREWGNKYDYITTSNGYITGNGINKYLGSANVSAPSGSESKQAMKYGIHGGSFEVCEYFHFIDSTNLNTSVCLSRGAETYINLILVNLYNYDSNF